MVEAYSLYIHIPFCAQKCNYCDFNSIVSEDKLIVRYIQALQEEIKLIADEYEPKIKTIYIGGGTPTILSGAQLVDILEECRQQFELEAGLEVTIEANPGTVNHQQLKLIKEAGVNRLSFGVQSFNNYFLNQLGRIHTAKDVKDSYYLARKVGFDNISFDLMSALPGQSLEDWQNTLTQAIELGPEHLSTYNLKIESETVFKQWLDEGKIEKTDEDLDLEMYRMSIELLEQNNYQQYEISNFSQPQYKSEHNQTYWKNEAYLALGAGAHFYDGQARGYNINDIHKYCHKLELGELAIANSDRLTQRDKIEETMILGLRLNEGISLSAFENRFDKSILDIYKTEVEELLAKNLIIIDNNRIVLTDSGRELANRVLSFFI